MALSAQQGYVVP